MEKNNRKKKQNNCTSLLGTISYLDVFWKETTNIIRYRHAIIAWSDGIYKMTRTDWASQDLPHTFYVTSVEDLDRRKPEIVAVFVHNSYNTVYVALIVVVNGRWSSSQESMPLLKKRCADNYLYTNDYTR